MTLEETINFVEAKQGARKDVAQLKKGGGTEVNKVTDYRAAKFGKSGQDDQCHYCGLGGHGKKPDEEVRKEKCRAWDQECLKCKKKGHYARKCESKKGEVRKVERKECSSTAESSDEEAAVGPVIGSVSGLGPFCQIFSRQTSDGEESRVKAREVLRD